MVIILILIIILIIATAGFFMLKPQFGKQPSGERMEKIRRSPNYIDGAFQNITPTSFSINFGEALKESLFNNNKQAKPSKEIPSVKTDLMAIPQNQNVFVWFGHSSYFLQINGIRFLIDPVLSKNASPVPFINKAFKGTNIYTAEDIPPIDYLLITHDHYDHLDYKTVIALQPKIDKVICPLGVGEHFEYWGFNKNIIIEKDWNQSINIANQCTIHTVTSRHFSGRGLKRNQTLWTSYVLQTPNLKIFIGCDGGYGSHFLDIAEQFAPFNLAFLENGQYSRLWPNIHAYPEETVKIAQELRVKQVMPIHSAKFSISSHDWDEPLKRIAEAGDSLNLNILTPQIGELVDVNDTTQVFSRWWEGVGFSNLKKI